MSNSYKTSTLAVLLMIFCASSEGVYQRIKIENQTPRPAKGNEGVKDNGGNGGYSPTTQKSLAPTVETDNVRQLTPLHGAASEGQLEKCKDLVEKGADVDKQDQNGNTPLHLAAKNAHQEVVMFLLGKGAKVNLPNDADWTPLHEVAHNGDLKIAEMLIENGANVNQNPARAALHVAIDDNHPEIVKLLLDKGANVRSVSGRWSPLHEAASRGPLEFVEQIVEKGAIIDAKDIHGRTPLLVVSEQGFVPIVKYLLDKGANYDEADNAGYTPLHRATHFGHLGVVKALIGKGADVNKNPWSSLHVALQDGQTEIAEYLLANGAKPNGIERDDGWTPLHEAAFRGRLSVVKLLVKMNAAFNTKNIKGYTPLKVAKLGGHDDVVKYLESIGATE